MKSIAVMMGVLLLAGSYCLAGVAQTTFVQLNRAQAQRSLSGWAAEFARYEDMGINRVIVQWTAEPPISYFPQDTADAPYIKEQYDCISNILVAARSLDIKVWLGLQSFPKYWTQIHAPEHHADFLNLRLARNLRTHERLLALYDGFECWDGVYIPDEIDDLTWRSDPSRELMRSYIGRLSMALQKRDPKRSVAMSGFVRGRTAPEFAAENFSYLLGASVLDVFMLQDGAGVNDPPVAYLALYYDAFRRAWSASNALNLPSVMPVVELFEQTSKPGEPFSARPAAQERVLLQLDLAARYFGKAALFTVYDYVLGDESRHNALKQLLINQGRIPQPEPSGPLEDLDTLLAAPRE